MFRLGKCPKSIKEIYALWYCYRMDLVADILAGKEISGILLDERIKDII